MGRRTPLSVLLRKYLVGARPGPPLISPYARYIHASHDCFVPSSSAECDSPQFLANNVRWAGARELETYLGSEVRTDAKKTRLSQGDDSVEGCALPMDQRAATRVCLATGQMKGTAIVLEGERACNCPSGR